ncbi:MAG: FAD-dependent oxidoreductase [Deltaproteobacteria bacterium]|nr:FAD-dependent oxidoreductase [Deltaproteobacteria bacterium]
MNIGILGGGISGITLQRFLNHPSEILEMEKTPGGLCRTFWKDGFGYDIGGHILFSKYEHVNNLVTEILGENVNHCRRENKILFKGKYMKYPFENDLAALDVEDRYECLIGYLKNDYPPPSNLAEWAYHTFGKGIAEKYLIPYNNKIWKMNPSQISLEWVERIPKPPMEDIVKSALGIQTEGYLHQLFFRYPLSGGFESVIKQMTKKAMPLETGFKVRNIIRKSGGWQVSDGSRTREFEHIVISFPIHDALKCFQDAPNDILNVVEALRYTSIRIVFIAVNNESLMDKSAFYIPDPLVLPHRVCYMGFFSPNMVKSASSSLIAEITVRPGDELDRMSDAALIEKTVRDLESLGILNHSDIISSETRRFEYAYPIYDKNYSDNTKRMRAYFEEQKIDLLGRFAEFEYINFDECVHRAMLMAQKLNVRNYNTK